MFASVDVKGATRALSLFFEATVQAYKYRRATYVLAEGLSENVRTARPFDSDTCRCASDDSTVGNGSEKERSSVLRGRRRTLWVRQLRKLSRRNRYGLHIQIR
jgi:hypothetical protein